ncbi:hypothetical protein LCGC14_3038400 [marine sediment metagenome]|uniref:Uncharacterized protein n=1 Tax=marine sediment metagenome TaxID=412755 RepID=A0A0F8YYB4_9ZZZZ
MVFERVLKGGHFHSTILPEEISISKNCVVFGKKVKASLNQGFVEVFLDRKNNLVGFVSSKSPVTGYKIHKGNNTTGIFAKHLERKVYQAKLQDGLWVIKVKKIHEDIPTTKQNE